METWDEPATKLMLGTEALGTISQRILRHSETISSDYHC